MLDQQTQRLHQVVEEVLQLTRFEAGRLDIRLQPVSLVPFLQSLVEKMQAEWISGDHTCFLHTPDEEILVWADAGLLEIVLRNLFDNARKYTPPSTLVEVETEIIASTGQVDIRVIDDGPGIPADQQEHIFERFSRGPQSSRELDAWIRAGATYRAETDARTQWLYSSRKARLRSMLCALIMDGGRWPG